jgi:hypothetical protein
VAELSPEDLETITEELDEGEDEDLIIEGESSKWDAVIETFNEAVSEDDTTPLTVALSVPAKLTCMLRAGRRKRDFIMGTQFSVRSMRVGVRQDRVFVALEPINMSPRLTSEGFSLAEVDVKDFDSVFGEGAFNFIFRQVMDMSWQEAMCALGGTTEDRNAAIQEAEAVRKIPEGWGDW